MTATINLKKMKAKTAKTKLIDILSVSKEDSQRTELERQVEQCNINTQQEILNLKGSITAQDAVIDGLYKAVPFSATKLYVARKEKALMEMKLEGLEEIRNELF